MRWIKSSALFLAASLTLGAGLTALTADPAAGTTGQATLHKGSDKITLTWVARKNGAAFLGTIGNLSIEGSSVQPDPDVGTFDVSGKLEGKTNLHLTLSLASAKPTALAFRANGNIGSAKLKGAVEIAFPDSATGSGSLTLRGTLGGKAVSGTISLPADTTNHVAGRINIR